MIIGHEIVGWGARRVIALHGWFGDHRVWAPMVPFLDRDKFSYAFPDFRGYGMSRSIAGAHTIKERLERARLDFESARRAGDLNRMSELQYGVIPGLAKKLKALIEEAGGSVESVSAPAPETVR